MRSGAILLMLCAAISGCTDFESRTESSNVDNGTAAELGPSEDNPAPVLTGAAALAHTRTGGGVSVTEPQIVPSGDGAAGSHAPPPSFLSCGDICTLTTGAAFAGCGSFSFTGALAGAACGFASSRLCKAVCESQGPTSHCDEIAGGKACMNRERFWWCDTKVDGRKARARYELEDLSQPGVVHTAWAPSQGCLAVRWPTAGLVQRWQICVEDEGCSDWFYPNHHDATLSSYIPPGTPPSIEPPETPDITPPTAWVAGTDPNTWYQGVVPIIAGADDAESGVASMTVFVNDEPIYSTPGGALAISWDSSGYNGVMVVKVAATDGVGNTSFTWSNIRVVNRPPTVDLHVPPTVSSQVWFWCSVASVAPTTMALFVDGTQIDNGWQSTSVPDGEHTLICRGTDVMGRTAEASGVFYVYNHPGGLSWLLPIERTYTATPDQPIIEIRANADETDMDMAEIYDNASPEAPYFGPSSYPLCRLFTDPNAHHGVDLHCDGTTGPGSGWNIAGRAEGVLTLVLHVTSHNDYQRTRGDWRYSHDIYVDNSPPVIVLDAAQTYLTVVDGVQYVHLQATTPTAQTWYSEHLDSIERVEFFARMPDGSSASLGAVNSDAYPWQLTERVPDNAYVDSQLTLYAVATDTVYAHKDTPVHRSGTSAPIQLTATQPSEVPH